MREIWKWNSISTYDIPTMERWLGEMAANGLLFRGFFGPWARFAAGEKQPGRRYRLDVNPDVYCGPDDEMLEFYKQAGWTFVKKIWHTRFFVYYTDDPQAVEPYTDPQSRALSLAEVVRQCKLDVILLSFTTCIVTFSAVYVYLLPIRLPDTRLMLGALCPVIYVLNIIYAIRSFYALRQMKRWLEAGRPMDGFQMPKHWVALNRAHWIIAYLIVFAVIAEVMLPRLWVRTVPMEEARTGFPILSLAQIEGGGYVPDPYLKEELVFNFNATPIEQVPKILEHNFVRTSWLPLSPRCWAIEQSGSVSGREVSLDIQRYEMISVRLARPTLESLSRWKKELEEVQVAGADYFWTADGGDTVYAVRGSVVLTVAYRGDTPLSSFYDEIAAMLVKDGPVT